MNGEAQGTLQSSRPDHGRRPGKAGRQFTVPTADPLLPLFAAVIVAVPLFDPVTTPAWETRAVRLALEVHAHCLVRSCVLPSSNVPRAWSWMVFRMFTAKGFGVTAMDASLAVVTFTVADPLTEPVAAVMVEVPAATPVASP